MIVCGLKLTHDGAVALVDDGRLVFSVEMEKIDNAPRYSQVPDLSIVVSLLHEFGYQVSDVDRWVVDGWDGSKVGHVSLADHGVPVELDLAPYRETEEAPDVFQPALTGTFPLAGESKPFTSHVHIAGHISSAYCTSPFAERGEPSLVLIWDGGLFPRLYWLDPAEGVANGGALFPLIGHTYATAAHHFGPFRRTDEAATVDDLSVAGKLMAYIALGTARDDVVRVLRAVFAERFESDAEAAVVFRAEVGGFGSTSEPSMAHVNAYFRAVAEQLPPGVPDEDVLASVHVFLEDLLIERLVAKVLDWKGAGPWNLCFAGGCALNIKWNSALRRQSIFTDVWVPPFPNDSGSAIGSAALGVITADRVRALAWHPRLGPELRPTPTVPPDWTTADCSPEELARLLHESGAAVVVLNGRAELGPRALGNRSILAAPVRPEMKELLNRVKKRESYRPVAPICLAEQAPEVFSPGSPDPHMLFDHVVRPPWRDRIPAVLHLDGTARLQTVGPDDDPVLRRVLLAYYALSGVPVLCNTSANLNGSGFFPDVTSAIRWGQLPTIWSEGVLYRRR
ncbi:carbamoyltransferase N-terminal domain-containing protein [Micromonospora sp. WMMD1082]|uniref:carbamoyltransferase N-terminal domain-containing protein n=1 Tax=Micromonospora sp. WMMD1082 TaxID=3016104 RepID=UPI002415E63D|nr:carbamoyltransferase N-terminal domain-containing protein [Micromonospora sp. WMMD1082]MDG4792750.1 carbamoyltransferase N-terminal domain-containing protein [Micromonospora sp. WMMD1082]